MKNELGYPKNNFKKTVLLTAIIATLPVTSYASPNPSPNQGQYSNFSNNQYTEQAALDKYAIEGYNYCDSKVLAAFWDETDSYQSKLRLGEKMLRWGPQDGSQIIGDARNSALAFAEDQQPCDYTDGGFSYEDAALLADFWEWKDVFDVKLKMEYMLVQGHQDDIQKDLNSARARGVRTVNKSPRTPPVNNNYTRTSKPTPTRTQTQLRLSEEYSVQVDSSGVNAVAFSNDSRFIVTGGWENKIKVWDAYTGRLNSTIDLQGKGDLIVDIALSPNGRLVATGNRDYEKRINTIMVYNIQTGKEAYFLNRRPPDMCSDVAFSADGKYLAAGCFDHNNGGDRTLQLWDARTGKAVLTLQGGTAPIMFTPDGLNITANFNSGNSLKAWNATSGQVIGDIQGLSFNSFDFSPDSKILVGGSYTGELKTWDTITNNVLRTFSGHKDRINKVKYSPDGQLIATASKDKTVKLWNAQTGQQAGFFQSNAAIESLDFSPNSGQLVIGGMDGKITLFAIESVNNNSNNKTKYNQPKVNYVPKSRNYPKSTQPINKRVTNKPKSYTPKPKNPQLNQPPPRPNQVAHTNTTYRIFLIDSLEGEHYYTNKNNEVMVLTEYNNNDVGVVGDKIVAEYSTYQWQIKLLDGSMWYVDWNGEIWAYDANNSMVVIGSVLAD